jgi:hypothetical protein
MCRCPTRTALLAIALAGSARPLVAQAFASLDGGWARVTYDGFLATNAGSVSGALRLEDRLGTLSARGTLLRFESGNHSLSGIVNGNIFSRAFNGFRGEALGTVGASSYRGLAHYGYVLGRSRLHWSRAHYGSWVDGTLGQNYYLGSRLGIRQTGTGAWLRHDYGTLSLSAMRTWTGDTSYTDAEGALRLMQRYVDVDLSLGVRGYSIGAGRGVYGEASGTLWLRREIAMVLSGGRYPSDPSRGSIAGRYVSLAMKFGSRGWSSERGFPKEFIPRRPTPSSFSMPIITDLEMRIAKNGWRTFRLHVAGASHIELMGDFTEWQPVALGRAGENIWEVTLPISAGLHRFNVRADGGQWTVPLGFPVQSDDFGGSVGILLIQ